MNYNALSSVLLDRVFSNSAVKDLEGFVAALASPSVDPVTASLTPYEWERLRWGYWAPAYVSCISAWTDTGQLYKLDNDRMMTLLEDDYEPRIPDDKTRVVVGNYLRNRDDLRALKRSGAVPCSFFSRIEDQTTTRGTLARALAKHRISTLFGAFLEGLQISPMVERSRFETGEPTGFVAELISGMPNRTQDGLSRTAIVFSGFMLDSGEFRRDQKSMNIGDMLLELFQQTYKECRDAVSEHANT